MKNGNVWQNYLMLRVEDIKETDNEKSINQNFENITGNYVGSNNVYCNIPEYILQNQQEYIGILKKEIEDLKAKIAEIENKLK